MQPTKVKVSDSPYRMGGDYPNITVVFDYETKPLEGVMYALREISHRRLRKTQQHGYGIGIGSVWEDPKGHSGPVWLMVRLPIEPGNVKPLKTYIEEAQSIAEAAVFQGLNMKVGLTKEQKRVGDAIVVSLDLKHFTYSLKGGKHVGARRMESLIGIDDKGFIDLVVPRDPASLLKELQVIEAEAEKKEAEWDSITPDQHTEMRRQKNIAEKKLAAETRAAVERLRAEAKEWKWLEGA